MKEPHGVCNWKPEVFCLCKLRSHVSMWAMHQAISHHQNYPESSQDTSHAHNANSLELQSHNNPSEPSLFLSQRTHHSCTPSGAARTLRLTPCRSLSRASTSSHRVRGHRSGHRHIVSHPLLALGGRRQVTNLPLRCRTTPSRPQAVHTSIKYLLKFCHMPMD